MAKRRRKRKNSVAVRRKSPKRVAAGKKAARSRKRRLALISWRRAKGRKRRLTVKRTKRGLSRSPLSRLGYSRRGRKLRVNPYRRRRRRVRRNQPRMVRRLLGRWRLQRAVPILAGFAGGITLKPMVQNFIVPKLPITFQEPATKWFGVLTIMTGAFLSRRGRRRMTKDAGLGLIVAGLYDIIASNFANLPFIPKVFPGTMPGAAAESTAGLGTSIGQGNFRTVGAANLTMDVVPDTVGGEDLDDLI